MALTFATTYALGHAAQQCVGTARALSRADLLVLEAHDFEALLARRPELRIRILETARGLIASGILPSGDIVPEETHHHPKPSGSPKE